MQGIGNTAPAAPLSHTLRTRTATTRLRIHVRAVAAVRTYAARAMGRKYQEHAMYDQDPQYKTTIRRRAREIRRRLVGLCGDFERRTSQGYQLRGRASQEFCAHVRDFWRVRDRLRLNLHTSSRSCPPERAPRMRKRIDRDWLRVQELAAAPRAGSTR